MQHGTSLSIHVSNKEAECLKRESVYERAKPTQNSIGCAVGEGNCYDSMSKSCKLTWGGQ